MMIVTQHFAQVCLWQLTLVRWTCHSVASTDPDVTDAQLLRGWMTFFISYRHPTSITLHLQTDW